MLATRSLKLLDVLQRHFGNEADARTVIELIEATIDDKFEDTKETLATKKDIGDLKDEIYGLRIEMEKRFNTLLMWMIGTMIGIAGIVLAITKLAH